MVAAEPGTPGSHQAPPAGQRGLHPAGGRRAAPGRSSSSPQRTLAVAGRRASWHDFDLIADYAQPYSVAVICTLLGVPADRRPCAACLVARDRQDVRVAHRRGASAGGRTRGGRVHRLRPGPDRGPGGARPESDLITELIQVADAGRPAHRRRDRLHRHRAAQCRSRGHRQHPRQRPAGAADPSRPVAAGRQRRGRRRPSPSRR